MVECPTEDVLCLLLAEAGTSEGESESAEGESESAEGGERAVKGATGPSEGTSGPSESAVTTEEVLDALGVDESAVVGHFDVIAGLSALESAGVIETRTVALAGNADERAVYELTDAGRERAGDLESALAAETVTVRTAAGRERTTLGEAARHFDGSLARAAARLRDGVVVAEDVGDRVGPEAMPFVGRDADLARLDEWFERAQSRGDSGRDGDDAVGDGAGGDDADSDGAVGDDAGPSLVRVEGEPGVGKTYLATEFADRVADRGALALTGRCVAETGRPYRSFLDAATALPPASRDAVESALAPPAREGPDGQTVDDPEPTDPDALDERRRSRFATVARELAAVADDRPLVLVLDDAQWVDRPTALLVAHLADALSDEPFLAVLTSYPEGTEPADPLRAAVAERRVDAERLALGPFDRETSAELVARLVGTRRAPASFVDRVHDHTGGHPLFVVETVTRLLETGVVRPGVDVYPADDEELPVPASVEAAVDARLAGLDAATRTLLETAALVGTVVPEGVLTAASPLDPVVVRERTELLVESRLWAREDDDTVRFVSDVVRETVRDGVDPDRRREVHRRIARAYDHSPPAAAGRREDGERTGENAAAAAHHYEQAGERTAALAASLTAAEYATDVYAHELAVEACERAVSLAREVDETDALVEALELLGDTYRVVGEYGEAARCYRFVRERAPDRGAVRRTYLKEGAVERSQGEFEAARDRLERGIDLATAAGDAADEARLRNELGQVEKRRGEFGAAREQFDRALELARGAGDEATAAQSLHYRGQVADKRGDLDAATDHYERALDRFRDLGDRRRESQVLGNLGIVAEKRGDYDAAREYHERSLAVDRDLGDRHREAVSLNNLGVVEREEGDYAAAREYHEESLDLYRTLGDRHGEALVLGNLGAVAQSERDLATAREYFRRSLERKRAVGDRQGQARSLGNLGLVAADEGRFGTARESLEECLEAFRDLDDRYGEARALQFLGSVAAGAGAVDDARAYLEQGLALERELGNEHGEARTLDALGAVDRAEGRLDRARQRHRDALETFRAVGDPNGEAECLVNLGLVAFERVADDGNGGPDGGDGGPDGGDDGPDGRGDGTVAEALATATDRFREARDAYRDLADPVGEHRCLGLLGATAVLRSDAANGRDRLDEALAGLRSASMPPVELEVVRRHLEAELRRADAGLGTDTHDIDGADNADDADGAEGTRERVRDLCERASERIEGTDAVLGRERGRIETLCARVGDATDSDTAAEANTAAGADAAADADADAAADDEVG